MKVDCRYLWFARVGTLQLDTAIYSAKDIRKEVT